MILKKPYKFLMKHFRFIHLIMSVISIYLMLNTNKIINFFSDYLGSNNIKVGVGTWNEFLNLRIIILLSIMFFLTLTILFILGKKDKPIRIYILNLVIYFMVVSVYLYTYNIIEKLEDSVLDIRIINLGSDLSILIFIMQTISTIYLAIRAVGFDLKKFNFEKDYKLELTDQDEEEIEVSFNFDQNSLRRNLKRDMRNMKYTYLENKFIINILMLIAIVSISAYIYIDKNIVNKIYKENQMINTSNVSYTVKKSYITNQNYRNKVITDNALVIVKIGAKSNMYETKFETAKLQLYSENMMFNVTEKYNKSLTEFGNFNLDLKNEQKDLVLVYEIPENYINKKLTLKYNDNNKTYNVVLNPTAFDDSKTVNAKIKEKLVFDDEIIKNVDLRINEIEIKKQMTLSYNFCEDKNTCYESYEHLTDSLTSNYDMSIMKLNVDFNSNKNDIKKLEDIIEKYGIIKYTYYGEEKVMDTKIKSVTPLKYKNEKMYFFEVYEDIEFADEITLILTVRNQKYEYKLR